MWLEFSCGLSAREKIHMKCQTLISLKNKIYTCTLEPLYTTAHYKTVSDVRWFKALYPNKNVLITVKTWWFKCLCFKTTGFCENHSQSWCLMLLFIVKNLTSLYKKFSFSNKFVSPDQRNSCENPPLNSKSKFAQQGHAWWSCFICMVPVQQHHLLHTQVTAGIQL